MLRMWSRPAVDYPVLYEPRLLRIAPPHDGSYPITLLLVVGIHLRHLGLLCHLGSYLVPGPSAKSFGIGT